MRNQNPSLRKMGVHEYRWCVGRKISNLIRTKVGEVQAAEKLSLRDNRVEILGNKIHPGPDKKIRPQSASHVESVLRYQIAGVARCSNDSSDGYAASFHMSNRSFSDQ